MGEFLHQLASGVALGGVYAIMALALVMIYQATQLINFAQGEMAMFSTYFAWKLIDFGQPYWFAFFATVAVSFIGGVVIERLIVRPFANAPVLASVIVFIGLQPDLQLARRMALRLFGPDRSTARSRQAEVRHRLHVGP